EPTGLAEPASGAGGCAPHHYASSRMPVPVCLYRHAPVQTTAGQATTDQFVDVVDVVPSVPPPPPAATRTRPSPAAPAAPRPLRPAAAGRKPVALPQVMTTRLAPS